ncbi:hypothetical protein AgCh_002537 [Apium graveolens]
MKSNAKFCNDFLEDDEEVEFHRRTKYFKPLLPLKDLFLLLAEDVPGSIISDAEYDSDNSYCDSVDGDDDRDDNQEALCPLCNDPSDSEVEKDLLCALDRYDHRNNSVGSSRVTVKSYGFRYIFLSLFVISVTDFVYLEIYNILEENISYIEFSIMVNESEVIVGGGSSSGATAGAIDWTTYSFPQAVELTGLPEKFNGGIGFSRWQKRMKLWLTIKVKAFAKWAEKDGVARAAILAALTNTLFDVYSSDAYSAKLLWEKLDQTHNTDSQDLEKYSVARFLEFKLVDNKSMTEQVHEFEMIVHALKESGMNLPEKFKVMSVIEKLPKSWEEFSLSLKRQK